MTDTAPRIQPLDPAIRDSLPADATRVLVAGVREGDLALTIRLARPGIELTGLEGDPAAAARARARIGRVGTVDPDGVPEGFEPRSFDAVVCDRWLERAADPLAALRRLVFLLRPEGTLLLAAHNAQHHRVITALLRGDLHYGTDGAASVGNRRLLTYATLIKTMLDAGLIPRLLTVYVDRLAPSYATALEPLLGEVGVEPARAALYFNAAQFLFEARPHGWPAAPEEPMTFVACANNEDVLRDNLLASPCLGPGSPHQIIVVRDARSAAEGLNRGIAEARHPIVVGVHQDVYLPDGWPARFLAQYRAAEARFGRIGLAGVYGTRTVNARALRFGHVMDRHNLLREPQALPARVETMDELLLAVPRDTPLRFEPAVGFHLYGTDMACACDEAGLASVVLDAPCFHNSQLGDGLPRAFHDSATAFRGKWSHRLPIATASDVLTTG